MTSRGRSAIRAARLIALTLAATSVIECASDSPSGPRVLDVRSAGPLEANTAPGPTVSSANPSYGDQGTTLDVQILGSGFTSGATVGWLLNGVPDSRVHTNSAQVKSASEIDANITIASDAVIAFRDVQVSLIGGKNGVGSDAFEVTSAQIIGPEGPYAVTGINGLLEISGYYSGNGHAFVLDDASRFIDLGPGQAWALEPRGSTVLGRDTNFPNEYARAWTRQADGSWTATTLPPAPNSYESNATSAAYAPDGSLLVGGWDGEATGAKPNQPQSRNRPVAWQRSGTTWMAPVVYSLPAGATAAGARAINGMGEIAGNVDASGMGAVWDSPTSPVRLDGLPLAINSAGTLLVGQRTSGSSTIPVYWWRDPVTRAWNTTGVVLPSIATTTCTGAAQALNDAGVVVGESCNGNGKTQATVWVLDLSGSHPVLVGSPQALPGLGAHGGVSVESTASGVSGEAPYRVVGIAAISSGQTYPVRWQLR